MNLQSLLAEARQYGVIFTVDNDRLRCKAPKQFLTASRRQGLEQHRAELLAMLRGEPFLRDGRELLAPFLPVIKAAHRNELPSGAVCMSGQEYDLADYICCVSAGLWYGQTLNDPLLPAWLENLRRLQAWYEELGTRPAETMEEPSNALHTGTVWEPPCNQRLEGDPMEWEPEEDGIIASETLKNVLKND